MSLWGHCHLHHLIGRENLILLSRSLLQRDIHLHKQQPTNDRCNQLGDKLGSEHKQRQGRQWQQLQQQLNQHGEQRYDQQQLRKEKAKSSQDRPRFQRKTDDFHFWKADWRLSRKRGRESNYIKLWTFWKQYIRIGYIHIFSSHIDISMRCVTSISDGIIILFCMWNTYCVF